MADENEDKTAAAESTPGTPGREAEDVPVDETPESDSAQSGADSSEANATEPAAEEAPPAPVKEPDPEDDLPRKERNRLRKSRRPHQARPARDGSARQAEREAERARKAKARAKRRAEAKAGAGKEKGTGTPAAEHEANSAKSRQGIVVSNKADKTITVRIDIARRHPVYEKIVRRSRTLHAHDERNEAGEGDTVRVVETRPLSKTKRWRLEEVLEKAK